MKDADNPYLVDGKYSISDLVDLEGLRNIFEKFSLATGFTIGFVEHPSQEILISTGWFDICTKFHRAFSESAKHCLESNIKLTSQLKEAGQLVIEECGHGLVDCATPIIVKGRHIASLATGQVLLNKPDIRRFKRQAKIYGYDSAKYLDALRNVPVVSEEKLRNVMSFLSEIAMLITESGLSNIEIKEKTLRLEKEIIQRKQAEEKLIHTNRLYAVLSQVNQTIVRIRERNQLFQEICRITVEYGGFRMVWIGLIDPGTLSVKPVTYYGFENGYLEKIRISINKNVPEGQGPTGTAIREGKYFINNNTEDNSLMLRWREEALKREYLSSGAFPMKLHDNVIGAFTVYSSETNFFNEDEIRLLSEITDDISFAIGKIEYEEKHKQAEEEIRKRVKELEDFYDMAVGRELRMKELKEEIESLKEELERCKGVKNL